GDRLLPGHGGWMPGCIAQRLFSPQDKVVTVAVTNESQARLGDLGLSLVRTTVEEWPVAPEAWRVGEPPRDDVVPLLGIWFMESAQLVFAGARGSSRRATTECSTGNLPLSSNGRRTIAGAPVQGRSTARRRGSSAARTARSRGWSGPATRSHASRARGALRPRNARNVSSTS